MRRLFEFLGEPWDDAVLRFDEANRAAHDVSQFPQNPEVFRPLYTSAMARWRRDMDAEDVVTVKRIAGPLLVKLGYVADQQWGLDSAASSTDSTASKSDDRVTEVDTTR